MPAHALVDAGPRRVLDALRALRGSAAVGVGRDYCEGAGNGEVNGEAAAARVVRAITDRSKEMAKEKLSAISARECGTIGHIDHGKDHVDAAIHQGIAEAHPKIVFRSFDSIDNARKRKHGAITIATRTGV